MDQIAGSVLACPQFDIQTLSFVLLSSNFMCTSIRGPVSHNRAYPLSLVYEAQRQIAGETEMIQHLDRVSNAQKTQAVR